MSFPLYASATAVCDWGYNSEERPAGQEYMRREALLPTVCIVLLSSSSLAAQTKRLWVIREPAGITEYDPTTFVAKQTAKLPPDAVETPQGLSINHLGQMLFVAPVSLPLDESDLAGNRKFWFWEGNTATTLPRDLTRTTGTTGSNLAIDESVAAPYLSADGSRLYWFSNRAHRLQREGVDLSTKNTWAAWQTDLAGGNRQDLAAVDFPDCSCPTGGCEETCPYDQVWVPDEGVSNFFLLTKVITGKDQPTYKSSSLYRESSGKWNAADVTPAFRRVLDAAGADAILEAVPDTGCCGWANLSDDQTLLRLHDKTLTVYDERAEYKNPDYDVSFYTEDGKLSPDLDAVAFTVVATAGPNQPIQLAQQGQADPQESERIRKNLLDLPAVEIKTLDIKNGEESRRIEFLPHATLAGWINEKEILIIEDHLLVIYNVTDKARRKSDIRVEDAAQVFLR
jgi:hypothetical protein